MSSKGRGSFFVKAESGSSASANIPSGDLSLKDSGLGTKCSSGDGEYRRVGRGRLIDDIASSASTSIAGRGRAKLIDSLKDLNISPSISSVSHGRGRAMIFQSFSSDQSEVCDRAESTVHKPKAVATEDKAAVDLYFNPEKYLGCTGKSVKFTCNYLRVDADPNKGVFVYEVRFSPNVDSMNLRVKYLNEHRDKFGGTKTFDGVTLYLPILLKDRLTTYVSKSIMDNSSIEVKILYKKKETLKNCIHLYNILFDRVMKTLNYVRFDRKQFDPTAPKIIPHLKLEVWPGYVTAVDEYKGGLLLCCDVSHRILCQKTVLETLAEMFHRNENQFQENAKKALLGSVVITRYNNRTYRIDDIFFDKNPLSTFQVQDKLVSYVEYYRTNYNIEIKEKKQPLLVSIKKQKAYGPNQTEDLVFCLIPEICYLTGLRDDMRSDNRVMREIATHTRVSPNQRLNALEKFYTNINNSPEASNILKNWGLILNKSIESTAGRQLEEELIYFGTKQFSAGPNADFSKYAVSNEMLDVINLNNWLLIHCRNDTNYAQSFLKHMDRNARSLGVQVQRPQIVVLDNDRTDTYVQALRKNITSSLQIVVCMCPTQRDDRYSAIKKICCAEIPIASQVICSKTLAVETRNRAIVQKIALQINCKLGGSLWSVKIPFKNVMICGIDSYHDADQKGNSVAALVASLNPLYTKWYSKAVIQSKKVEIVNGLCSSFIAALTAFKKENGKLPDNIIIYRDGVGDGQLKLCANYEIPQMEAACKNVFPDYSPKITFIVVQKRINTRYFLTKGADVQNPLPGSIVDDNITRKNQYDFFLVSQSVKQGTVSPSHYVVVRDDAQYNPDIIQRLTYKLCFMYYNWPGTIRIPACCQYAHKMAYLIGQNVRRTPAEELSSRLFYL